jgi:hypothetical protein
VDIVVIDCPDLRKALLVNGTLVYFENPADPTCCNADYDVELIAERLARAAGVGVQVHRVDLPGDFGVADEDGFSTRWTPEDVAGWWRAACDAEAETAAVGTPPPAYPALGEQLLGVLACAGLEVSDEARRLAAELERAALAGTGGGAPR